MKLTSLLVATFILAAVPTLGGSIPKININGNKVLCEQSPFVEKGTLYVPLKTFENLVETTGWDKATKTATIKNNLNTIEQRVGSNTARVNSQIVEVGAPALIKNNTTYVPAKFVTNVLGGELSYNSKTNVADITYEMPSDKIYDDFNRIIKTSSLPKNSKDFSYIALSAPNAMYEVPFRYTYGKWTKPEPEGNHWIRPINMNKYKAKVFSTEKQKAWIALGSKHLDLIMNYDYKTVTDQWCYQVADTYFDKTIDNRYYMEYVNGIREYRAECKKNQIKIEGDYCFEPSITYYGQDGTYMRTWVKFRISSPKVKKFTFLDTREREFETNKWYTGYIDVPFASNAQGDGFQYKVRFARFCDSHSIKPSN